MPLFLSTANRLLQIIERDNLGISVLFLLLFLLLLLLLLLLLKISAFRSNLFDVLSLDFPLKSVEKNCVNWAQGKREGEGAFGKRVCLHWSFGEEGLTKLELPGRGFLYTGN